MDECPPDRSRNPRCFNGLPYHTGFPQVRIVCQQIRGHSVHNFAVAKSLTRSLSWAAWHSKRAGTHRITVRADPAQARDAPASARAANDREPHSPVRAYWSVYELTHRTPGARRAAGLKSTRTECPKSIGTLFLPVRNHNDMASH